MFWKYSVILLLLEFSHLLIRIEGVADCLSAKQNCSQCISTSEECFWCEDPDFRISRCDTRDNLKASNCKKITMEKYTNPGPHMEINNALSNKPGEIIQLKPQKVNIKLRAGSQVTVPISYQRAEDYPMDLYYLMDLSCTMLMHKKILEVVGNNLAKSLTEATSNFRIGFGSFVDKPIMPFSSFNIESVECQKQYGEPPYSFSHKQTLTGETGNFVDQVNKAGTSGNVDNPEGTLDALMQVLTCKNEIGWRKESYKIIVVATDAEFHYAGDGKLAGIITPNDGECHMSNNNYTHYNLTDYPSMHQIAEKAQGFNLVFSVSDDVKPVYERLAKIIGRNAKVASLKANDREAIKLINDTYNSIRSSVELVVKQKPDFIDIDFYSKCQINVKNKTSFCEYKEIKEIMFDAVIKLKYCPKDSSQKAIPIRIGLPNNVNEVVDIYLETVCGCECDNSAQNDSPYCSEHGNLACGVCKCKGTRTGVKCECDPEKPVDAKDPDKYCRHPNRTSICSNRGNCVCNKCDCEGSGYQGDLCEIDEAGCYPNSDRDNKICNGHGRCINGKCDCYPGYNGTLCECPESKANCITNGKECSKQGSCVCGKCQCKESTTRGEFCQFCPSCERSKYCNESRECVPEICQTFYGSKDNCTEKCDFNYSLVKTSQELDNSSSSTAYKTQCIFQTLDDECGVEFSYERIDDELTNQKIFRISNATKNCKEKLNLVLVSSSVVAGTLIVGLALLIIWKLLTEIWDRREYARFQKELSKVNWEQSENPLYKEAKSTFTNPMFALRERATKRLSRITERFSRRFDVNN